MREIAKKRLREYLKAEESILNGAQSYTIGDRSLTRGDLKEIRAAISALVEEIRAGECVNTKRVIFI